MKNRSITLISGALLLAAAAVSCSKPLPTAEIFATIDHYEVTFTPTVSDVNTYEWNFGDNSAKSTEQNPVHTYESFGDYTVTLIVSGDGGSFTTSKTITIEATSLKDLLTGGINATSGKTWVLNSVYTVGDGGGPVQNPPYTIAIPSTDNVLSLFGLGAEYDNEYTFHFDGTYSINAKNGNVLAGAVFGYINQTIQGSPAWDIGLCAATFSSPASATWTLHTENMTVETIPNANDTNVPPTHTTVTITGQNWISLSDGAFFGILDFQTTRRFVIDEITSNKMSVSMFVCGYSSDGGNISYNQMPTNMFHLTFVKK
jgi:PKD repeat protein